MVHAQQIFGPELNGTRAYEHMTQVQCEISVKSPLTPPRQWGTLLSLNSNSTFYCHRKLQVKGDFPSCQMRRLKGKCPDAMVCWLALASPLYLSTSSERPSLVAPPLLLCCFFSKHSFHMYLCVYLCGCAMPPFPTH